MSNDKKLILVSYSHVFNTKFDWARIARRPDYEVMFDSGAFTNSTNGTVIKIDSYIQFIKVHNYGRWYIQLDVVGEPEETYDNYLYMKGKGIDVIPVIQFGATAEQIEYFFLTADIVAFAYQSISTNAEEMARLYDIIGENRNRIHLLGTAALDVVRKYRPYSCDASTNNTGQRFGKLILYDKILHKYVNVIKDKFTKRPSRYIDNLMTQHKTKSEYFAKAEAWKNNGSNMYDNIVYENNTSVNLRSVILMQKDMLSIGVKYYVALGIRFFNVYEKQYTHLGI